MRPGRRAERDRERSLAPQIGRKSVRAANCENCVGDRLIAKAAQMLGKSRAVDALAALVERHQHGFFRDLRRNRAGFLRHPGYCVACTAFRNFTNLEAAKAELAADVVEALAVALRQFPLGALLQPADGDDDETHTKHFPAKWNPV